MALRVVRSKAGEKGPIHVTATAEGLALALAAFGAGPAPSSPDGAAPPTSEPRPAARADGHALVFARAALKAAEAHPDTTLRSSFAD